MNSNLIPAKQGPRPASSSRSAPIIERAPLPTVEVQGATHVVSYVNSAFCRLLGKKREELIGKTFAEIVHEGDVCVPILDQVYQTGEAASHAREDVSEREPACWLYAMWPALDEHDRPVGVIVQLTRSTRFRQETTAVNEALLIAGLRQHELREAAEKLNAQLRFMAESMPQKIFTAKPDGEVDYFNAQWMGFAVLTFDQIRGWGWLQLIHPDDAEENLRQWKRCLETGAFFQLEHRFRRHDGVYRWHLTRAQAMRDAQGRVMMWIGSNTDIDDQKRAEVHLEDVVTERTARMRETIGELEAFSYTISHDMRAPLRALQGFAQILLAEHSARLDADGVGYLERISAAARRMDTLIRDVLIYTRVLRAEMPIQPIELDKVVREIIATYPQLDSGRADIAIQGVLPKVMGHEASLTQCLSNLLSNAVKFVPSGTKPRVQVRAESVDSSVRLWVEDNGVGIRPEDQGRVFKMFERVHPNTDYEGTGIGLAIVRKAAERMGGTAGVESETGKGSRFWIQLKKG